MLNHNKVEDPFDQDDTILSDAADRALQALKVNLAGEVLCSEYTSISARDCDDTGTFPLFFSLEDSSLQYTNNLDRALKTCTAPLLLLNPQSAHLFQSHDITMRDAGDPIIYISDPLEQHCRADLALHLARYDRLNLTAQIPELGVVLVGSAKGRVAILTLHRLDEGDYTFSSANARPHTFTMRLLALLPLSEQEEKNQRPLQALVGLATAPISGHTDGRLIGLNKRWKIMLTYRDHTVLSYEIANRSADTVLLV